MKAVILAGGLGTRIAEESDTKPKPMVEIGGRPLLWHIMKIYAHHGINDFVICLGYKGYVIKEFFFNYYRHMSDMCIDLSTGDHQILNTHAEDWRITLVDTGAETMTGGRLKRVAKYLDDETFCLTYGDGLADINIGAEIAFHKSHGKLATVCAVQPPGRFGVLNLGANHQVSSFEEKPSDEIGWINGGIFVLERAAIDYVKDDSTSWERAPLANLARDGQLAAFNHTGFWRPCDTLRDKRELESLWADERRRGVYGALDEVPEKGSLTGRMARWWRFVMGGGLNTAVTYVVYLALGNFLNYQLAFLIAYAAGIAFSYCYNAKVVFRMPITWKGMMAYPMVYIVQYAISALALGVLVESLNLSKVIAPVLVAVATLPLTYVLSKTIIKRSADENS